MKRTIKLNENDIHKIIKNVIKNALKESSNPYWGDNDDEKIRKRNDNYIDDVYGDNPSVYDTVAYEDDPEGMEGKIALKRREAHNTHPDKFDDMHESKKINNNIKLSESELHSLIKETVKNIINEVGDTPKGQKALGALYARQEKKAKSIKPSEEPYKWSKAHTKAHNTFMHAFNNGQKNKSKWDNKNLGDSEHPFNQGYDEYNKTNESNLHNIIENCVKMALKEEDSSLNRKKRKGAFNILKNTNWNTDSHESNFPKNNPNQPFGDYWDEYDKADKERKGKKMNEDFEEEQEEFNPWMDGTASWIDGEYDIPYGFHVVIDTKYSTVSIEDPNNEDNGYFLQGDEADDLINQICQYYVDNDVDQETAVNAVISNSGY